MKVALVRAVVVGLLTHWTLAMRAAELADKEPVTFWKQIEDKRIYERIWETLQFYENESNDFIQAASVVGRYHGQFWAVDSKQGSANGWENRRIFLGAEALFFRQLSLHAQIQISEDLDPFYEGIYQALVEWVPHDRFKAAVGRVDFLFCGLERSTSSTRIVTFERGLLSNQLMPGEVVGMGASGKHHHLSYRIGVFSGSINQEFTDFSGGVGAVAGLGWSLPLFYESGSLHLDYLFNDGNAANNAFRPYRHIVSLWHQGQAGPFGLGLDLSFAEGLGANPSVMGLTVLSTWNFATNVIRKGDAFQAALRYQIAFSDGDDGLHLQSRYEQEVVPSGRGDQYQAIYAGINYLAFGDRLKFMTGVEYSNMRDSASNGGQFDGWTCLAGVRLFF